MTTTTFPRIWSSNTNYSAGPDVGTPTKVDPGAALAAEGFEPGPVDAQHVNYLLNGFTAAQMRALVLQALKLRGAKFTYSSDTTQSLAAVQRGRANPLLVMKIAGAIKLEDSDMVDITGGAYSTLTGTITGAAFGGASGGVLVAVGDSGSAFNDVSLDGGTTWSAGFSSTGGKPGFIAYSAVGGVFLVGGLDVGANVLRTTDPTSIAWSLSNTMANTPAGIAVLSSGRIVLLSDSLSGGVHFLKSTDNGANFSATSGTIHDAGLVSTVGSLVGNGGSLIYHAVVHNGLQISSSPDGDTWTVLTTIPVPAGSTFPGGSGGAKIMMCQNTGLLVVAIVTNSALGGDSGLTFYGSLDGVNWFGPSYSTPFVALTSFAVAGGRLIGCQSKSIYVSDGIDF